MKNIKIIVILIITIIFATNCTKQNNCDCGYEGKFIYYKKPLNAKDFGLNIKHGNPDIDAVFYAEGSDYGVLFQDYVPLKFRTEDTIHVSICYEPKYKKIETNELHFCPSKIKCIERIE